MTLDSFMDSVINKNPEQIEFHQAVKEVMGSIWPFLDENPHYMHANIIERLVEPERVIMFRVPWVDDQGNIQVNRGFRVEFNSAIVLHLFQWEEVKEGLILILKVSLIMK